MLEFEKKVLLSEPEYRFLKENRYRAGKTAVQVNHYYDTDDFALSRQGITCRIREKNGVCTATVKEHQQTWADCSVENSRSVKDRYDDLLFRNMKLRYQGSLETVRTIYFLHKGISVMLDKNSYLGTTDYELEIEYVRDAEVLARKELDGVIADLVRSRIAANEKTLRLRIGQGGNKSARFFRRKAETAAQRGGGGSAIRSE